MRTRSRAYDFFGNAASLLCQQNYLWAGIPPTRKCHNTSAPRLHRSDRRALSEHHPCSEMKFVSPGPCRSPDETCRGIGIARLPEDPVRHLDFSIFVLYQPARGSRSARRKLSHPQRRPAAPVGNKSKGFALPLRLKHPFVCLAVLLICRAALSSSQTACVRYFVLTQLRRPEIGVVPRHIRQVPAQPSQATAIGRRSRRSIEVRPAHQSYDLARAICRHQSNLVGRH